MNIDTILKIIVSTGIILLPVVLLVRDWKFSDKKTENHYTITRWLIIAWLVVSLGSVVIIYRDNRKIERLEYQEKVLARDSVIRMHEYLKIYMIDYLDHIDILLNINMFSDYSKIPIKTNFPFERIKNILGISVSWSDKLGEKYYVTFFKSQNKLLEQIRRCILEVNLKYYPELSEILLSFIKETESDNPSENFYLAHENIDIKKLILRMIDDSSKKIKYPADLKPYRSNTLRPYVRLYNMVNEHIEFYEKYNSFMKNLLNKNKSNLGIE